MKILLVSPKGNIAGGIARWTGHILQYYQSIQNKPFELNLLDTARSTFMSDDIKLWPRLKLAWKDYRAIIKKFNKETCKTQYNLIHITSSASLGLLRDIFMLKKAHAKGIKAIIHFRFGRIPQLQHKNNWEWKLIKKVSKKADRIIVIDKMSYDTMVNTGFNNVVLLPNPLSPKVEEFIKANFNISREQKTILFVGHCIRPKGVYELVEACRDISDIKLKLVGAINNEVKKDLVTIAENKDWLNIIGEQNYDYVLKEMLACDIFVLPTYTEGFPNVILEAMACGCAIVTTPVGAIPEILEEEDGKKYGIMISPKNVAQLQQAIKTMLSDTILKESCKSNVKERVITRYSMPKVWERLMTIWYQLSDIQ